MGGGEINVQLLASMLAKKKIEVLILTSYHQGLLQMEKKDGITIYRRLKTGKDASTFSGNVKRASIFPKSTAKEVKRILKEEKIDAIHFIGTSIIAAPQLHRSNVPLFATIESYPALCPKGDRIFHGKKECTVKCSFLKFLSCQSDSGEIGKMKNRWCIKYNAPLLSYIYRYYQELNDSLKYCHLIAISGYVQGLLRQQGHESTTVPNAIKINDFKVVGKKKNKKEKIIFLGAFIKSKGAQVLLEAIEGLDAECELYGEGVLKEELRAIIAEKKLNAKICLPVSYDKIPSVYADADIIVFPSLWPEPFGRIAIEAMAAGKPVIGSAIGGIKETVKEGTGILVDPGNVQQLREAIELLLHEPALRKNMGLKGRRIAKELYAEERVADQLLLMYKSKASLYQNRP